jgi:hypothetical protein
MAEDTTGALQGGVGGFQAGMQTGNPIAAVVGGLVGTGLGAMTGSATRKARVALENTIAEYMSQLQNLDMPRYEDLKLSLQRYANGEPLTVEQMQALQELDSEVSKIAYDKTAKQTQLDALAALRARSRGGLTMQDKADLMNAQREIDRQQSGVQKSIIQNMQARGVGGSGMELAARMGANQQGVQQASQNAMNVAANAQNRALSALRESASLGRQIGQDQLNLDESKARALDEMRRRNIERQQQAMQFNVTNKNQANLANWNRVNTVSDKNVDTSNEEQIANKQKLMEDYYNQVNRLKGIYGGKVENAQNTYKRKAGEQAGYMDMIGSSGNLFSGISGMFGSGGKAGTPTTNKSSTPSLTGGNWNFDSNLELDPEIKKYLGS